MGARDLLDPVTVAGPRRLLTGLPLTTDRYRRRVYPARTPAGAETIALISERAVPDRRIRVHRSMRAKHLPPTLLPHANSTVGGRT